MSKVFRRLLIIYEKIFFKIIIPINFCIKSHGLAFIKYIHEKSTTVEGMTCNRDEGSQQRCPLIARHAAGLLAFITIDLSVRVSRFAFVIAALGYIFMPTRSAKRRQQPSEKRAFITNRPRNGGLPTGIRAINAAKNQPPL